MKKIIIKAGKFLMLPVMVIAIGSLVFKETLSEFRYILIAGCILLFLSLVVILSAILEFIDNKKEK